MAADLAREGEAVGGAGSILASAGDVTTEGAAVETGLPNGSFSISDWSRYPVGVPQPEGPFRLIDGTEYEAARTAANSANTVIRKNQGLVGAPVDIHEIHPVKFGGSPTDMTNKITLPRDVHRQQVTPWWNQLQKDIQK